MTPSFANNPTPLNSGNSQPGDAPQPPALSPAGQFLARTNLLQTLAPLRALNQEMRLEHPQLDEFFAVLDQHPAVLKTLLKFANGKWFNSRVQVDSAYMAYTRFGTEGFYRLVIGAFLANGIGELSTKKFRIWPHLESVALAGQLMAQQLAPKFADEVFAAGLLHDAAIAPMQRELEDYLYFLECALNTDAAVTTLERHCNEFDHAQAASELAEVLAFDEHIVEAIACHHHENMSAVSAGNSRVILGLLTTTKRALAIARGHKREPFETAAEKALLKEIAAALGLSPGRILTAVTEVIDQLNNGTP